MLFWSFALYSFAFANNIDKNKNSDPNQKEIHSYKIEGSVSKLFHSNKLMKNFCNRILRDLIDDLAKSKIIMPQKLKEYYISISIINMINGNEKKTFEFIEKIREIEKKPEKKIMCGFTSQVLIESGYGKKDLYPIIYDKLKFYNWIDIHNWILSEKKDLTSRTRESLYSVIKTQFDPVVNKFELISLGVVHQILRIYHYYYFILPYKETLLKAYSEIIRKNQYHKVIYRKM